MNALTPRQRALTVNLPTAAELLGIGRASAYRLAQREQFPCVVVRVGRRFVVPRAALAQTLQISRAELDAQITE